jgi:hypothetical protein
MADKPINYRINIDQGRTSGADAIRRTQRDLDKLEKEARGAARAFDTLDDKVNNVGRGANFGRTGGGLERVLGATVGGGSQELLGLAGDIGDVVEGLVGEPGGLKGALGGILSSAGVLSISLAAVGVAFNAFNASLEEQKKLVDESAAAFAAYRGILKEVRDETLTSAEVSERIVEARKREADAQADLDALLAVLL